MLKYSSKIDHYIKTIIPLIILSNEYKVIGSYGRTIYITDIDITNYIQENMNFQDKLNVIIENLPNNIKLFTLTSGFDESYHVPWEIINENKTQFPFLVSHLSLLKVKSRESTGLGRYTNFEYIQEVSYHDVNTALASKNKLYINNLNFELAYEILISNGKILYLEIVIKGNEEWYGNVDSFTFN